MPLTRVKTVSEKIAGDFSLSHDIFGNEDEIIVSNIDRTVFVVRRPRFLIEPKQICVKTRL